jgi:hypothetical protein
MSMSYGEHFNSVLSDAVYDQVREAAQQNTSGVAVERRPTFWRRLDCFNGGMKLIDKALRCAPATLPANRSLDFLHRIGVKGNRHSFGHSIDWRQRIRRARTSGQGVVSTAPESISATRLRISARQSSSAPSSA